jgi:hypothetical protein
VMRVRTIGAGLAQLWQRFARVEGTRRALRRPTLLLHSTRQICIAEISQSYPGLQARKSFPGLHAA